MLLNHGVIGNGRLLALVNPDTSIDWLCMPRFDSPSVFARLLDEDKGGSFAFEAEGMRTSMRYSRNTNVLKTEGETPEGRFEILDFAPRIPARLTVEAPLEIHRLLRPLAGTPRRSS
jgi:alpha,alpha-trehalase